MQIAWHRINTLLLALVLLVLVGALARGAFGGPLDPPGPPGPTMKTLEQVEPRIPISQPDSAAGFPIIISQPGSYYLTNNITGVAGKDGIEVGAHDVTIDLNGFTIDGAPGSLNGIASTGWNTTILNGGVSSWGHNGFYAAAPNSHVSHVQVRNNAWNGIASSGGIIEDSVASNNGYAGIYFSGAGAVRGNQVANNGSTGLEMFGAVLVEMNDVAFNSAIGITIDGSGGMVRNNTVAANVAGGILAFGQLISIEANNVAGNYPAATIPFGIRVVGTNNFIVRNSASFHVDNFDIGPANTAGAEVIGPPTNPWSNVGY